MADNVIIVRITENSQVAKITRRTYSFARHVETGVRVYKAQNPRGYFPERIIYGKYNLCLHVRYAGQPPTCYRCGSTTYMIKNCQHKNDKNPENQHNENHDHDLNENHDVETQQQNDEEENVKEQESQTSTEMEPSEQNPESRKTLCGTSTRDERLNNGNHQSITTTNRPPKPKGQISNKHVTRNSVHNPIQQKSTTDHKQQTKGWVEIEVLDKEEEETED